MVSAAFSATLGNFTTAAADEAWEVAMILSADHVSLFATSIDFADISWTKGCEKSFWLVKAVTWRFIIDFDKLRWCILYIYNLSTWSYLCHHWLPIRSHLYHLLLCAWLDLILNLRLILWRSHLLSWHWLPLHHWLALHWLPLHWLPLHWLHLHRLSHLWISLRVYVRHSLIKLFETNNYNFLIIFLDDQLC